MDEGGDWKNELRAEPFFLEAGAHLWILERRHGAAPGIYNHLKEDDRSSRKQIPAGVRWCLNTLISSEGPSAYQMVFRSNPVDLY